MVHVITDMGRTLATRHCDRYKEDRLSCECRACQEGGTLNFPQCKYAGVQIGGLRDCTYLDEKVQPFNCIANVERNKCNGPASLKPASKASDYYHTGKWRVILLNWRGKRMVDALGDTLESLGWDVTRLRRGGDAEWKDECIDAIKRLRPQLLITQQRFYEQDATGKCQFAGLVGRACKEYNVATLIVDFGIAAGQEHYGVSIFDPKGDNYESSITGQLDELLTIPSEADAIEAAMSKVDDLRETLETRAKTCDAGLLQKYGLDDVPEKFAFLILQKSNDSVIKFDGCGKQDPKPLTDVVLARCREYGLYCVAKPHPFEFPGMCPAAGKVTGGQILPRMSGPDNHLVSAWLLKNAAVIITINSTMQYQAMALGTPIVTMGQGWFSDNGVTHEQSHVPASKFTLPKKAPDQDRRRQFLALMMSRQLTAAECEQDDRVEAIVRRFAGLVPERRSAITTVYSANEEVQAFTQKSLRATVQAIDGKVMAATDKGMYGWNKWCKNEGVEYVMVKGGQPPRMNLLLGEALLSCRGDLVWTIESDVLVDRDTLQRAEAVLRGLPPDVASLSLETVDEQGNRNFPSSTDIPERTEPDGELLRVVSAKDRKPYNCFAATLWRYHALARVDWAACRPLLKCDVDAGAQMHDAGWKHMVAPGLTAYHYPHMSILGVAPKRAPRIDNPLVSVVVLTCGRAETTRQWLPTAIEYLGHENIELILWDNGSTDDTPDILRDIQVPRKTIHLNHENIGKHALRHILPLCQGDYLFELDDDIEVPRDILATLLAAHRACPKDMGPLGIDYIWNASDIPYVSRWTWDEAYDVGKHKIVISSPETRQAISIPGACRLTPLAVAREWSYFRHYATDTDVCNQTRAAGLWCGMLTSQKFVHHCGLRGDGSVRGTVYHRGHEAR